MPLDRAVEVTSLLAPHSDWIEVGTSLIKRFGMAAVSAVVDAAEGVPVLADTKTADDGATEVAMCCDVGARATTVLAVTDSSTLQACVDAARDRGVDLVVDLLALSTDRRDELLLAHAGAQHLVWAAHIGKDRQASGAQAVVASALGPWAHGYRVAVAGGINRRHVGTLAGDWPGIRMIVGSAITAAPDPLLAALEVRAAMCDLPATVSQSIVPVGQELP
jgi:3-hexulose-6-phosphate synthase